MAPKVEKPIIVENIDPVNPKYKLPAVIVAEVDKYGALSSISSRVILIEDIHTFIYCKIEDICQEIDTSYKNLCINGKLKDDHTHLETKGLVHAMHVSIVFRQEWMRMVLIWVHDQFMWFDASVKITKDVLHIVTRYSIDDRPRAYKKIDKNKLCELTQAKWDARDLKLSIVDDLELRFIRNIISY